MLANKKQSLIAKSYKRVNEGASKPTPSETKAAKSSPAPKEQQPEATRQNSFESMAKSQEFEKWIQKYIANNSLVRLLVNRNGKRISIPCRILNFLTDTYTLTVYHVDEKQVYSFHLSEIIDLNE
jgi:hypothetical protein